MGRVHTALAGFHSDDPSYRAPRRKVSKSAGRATLKIVHPDEVIGGLVLWRQPELRMHIFLGRLLDQLRVVSSRSREFSEGNVNFMLSIIEDVKPRIRSRRCSWL